MSNAIGPLGAAASAVQGLQRAGALHEQAAVQVQRTFLNPKFVESLEKTSEDEAPPSVRGGAATVSLSRASRDLAGAFTDMTKAEIANAASVKVLQTAEDMAETLTRIGKARE